MTYREAFQTLLDDCARHQATADQCSCHDFQQDMVCCHTRLLTDKAGLYRPVALTMNGSRVGNHAASGEITAVAYRVNDQAFARFVLYMTQRKMRQDAAAAALPNTAARRADVAQALGLEDVQEPDWAMSTDGGDFYPGERTSYPSAERKAALAAAAARVNVASVTDTRGHWLEI